MNDSCIFCKMCSGEIKASVLYENLALIVVKDIRPQAPVHLLAIPKVHLHSLAEADEENRVVLGELLLALAQVARNLNIAENGYRVIINTRKHGGQEVDHLHIHLLGGEALGPMRCAPPMVMG